MEIVGARRTSRDKTFDILPDMGPTFLASGDKLKEPNANGDGKSLAFNAWQFQILLFTAQKSTGNSQNVIPSGDETSV